MLCPPARVAIRESGEWSVAEMSAKIVLSFRVRPLKPFNLASWLQSMFDLAAVLPQLLPSAIAGAQTGSEEVVQSGRPLGPEGFAVAKSVCVAAPERVRVLAAGQLPLPDDPALREACLADGPAGTRDDRMTCLGPGVSDHESGVHRHQFASQPAIMYSVNSQRPPIGPLSV